MRGLDLGVISTRESSSGEKNNPKGFQGHQREKQNSHGQTDQSAAERFILAEMAFPFYVGTAVRVGRELM